MKQSSFEAKHQAIELFQKMIFISASQHCLINTRIFICQSKKIRCESYTIKKPHFIHIQEIQQQKLQAIHQRELCLRATFSHFQQEIELNELRC